MTKDVVWPNTIYFEVQLGGVDGYYSSCICCEVLRKSQTHKDREKE